MSEAWARNEARARQMEAEEGKQVGYENRPIITRHDGAGRPVEFVQDSALGLDGRDIHVGGDKVSVLKEECLPGGDIMAYFQNERGGTYAQRWEKVADGTHRSAEKPRRVYGI
jgi:hypothetical protein